MALPPLPHGGDPARDRKTRLDEALFGKRFHGFALRNSARIRGGQLHRAVRVLRLRLERDGLLYFRRLLRGRQKKEGHNPRAHLARRQFFGRRLRLSLLSNHVILTVCKQFKKIFCENENFSQEM